MDRNRFSRRTFVVLSTAALASGRDRSAEAAQTDVTSVAAGVVDDSLLDATFAPDELPAGDARVFFYRLTLPPGETLTYLVGPFCGCAHDQVTPGIGVELVVSGGYAARLTAPFLVRRADGAEEAVAAGTEAVLGPGDAAMFSRYEAPGDLRAVGSEPAVVVGLAAVATAGSGTPAPMIAPPVAGEELSTLTELGWSDIATGEPMVLRLRRVELPAGSTLGPYESAGAETMLVEAGKVASNLIPPGQVATPGPPLIYEEGQTVPFLSLRPGSRRFVTNTGDRPAVLLVATIGPVAGSDDLG